MITSRFAEMKWLNRRMGMKSEIRNPKSELMSQSPMTQGPNSNCANNLTQPMTSIGTLGALGFGSDFGFPDFGFLGARAPAFTLIELLLVLVILAVLAAVVVPKFTNKSQQARITAAMTDISNTETALDTFEVENGRYPTTQEGLPARRSGYGAGRADDLEGALSETRVDQRSLGQPLRLPLPRSAQYQMVMTFTLTDPMDKKARPMTSPTGTLNKSGAAFTPRSN